MINSIHLKDVGPFTDLHIDCGKVIYISGPNGSGKTTLIRTMESVFENAHDASLIREGADKAEIVISISDGTTIERTITKKDTYARIKTADGRKIGKEETYLKSLAAGFALDPARLATSDKKKRLEFLLKLFPIAFTPDEIFPITGTRPPTAYTLDDLDALLSGQEEARTEINRRVKSQEATMATLTGSLPQDEETDWGAKHSALQSNLATKKQSLSVAITALDTEQGNAVATFLREKNEKITAIRERMQREIDQAELAFTEARDKAATDFDWSRTAKHNEIQPEIDRLTEEVATARERADAQLRTQGVRDSITKIRQEIRADALKATGIQTAITSLRELRKSKMETLPIPGVEIKSGDIFVDGKSFDTQLNEAEKLKVSFQICAHATGKLPFFICDHGSAFDDKNLKWITDAVKSAGFQLMITQVADQPELTVEAA
jgi:DNA repair exonuclease SbcCD ATPase subunit